MSVWVQSLFWVSLLGVVYTYLGYALLIQWLARRWPAGTMVDTVPRRGTVVIAAHDEAGRLPNKLRSLLSGRNGACVEAIWIGSDGSSDGTEAAVEALGDPRIRLVRFDSRRGKPAVLNDLMKECTAEFVVLTDARQEIEDGALAKLLARFADPAIGVVSGELIFRDPAGDRATAKGMNTYWRYEKSIRRAEARFRSVPGATGALYAMRRSLFRPIPAETLLDDVAIPMQAVMQGARCVFENEARVFDRPSHSGEAEEIRKRRTIAGNIQLARLFPAWLMPSRNPIWFEFMSHKMVRLISPIFLILMAASNLAVMPLTAGGLHAFYAGVLAVQACFYSAAAIGYRPGAHHVLAAAPAMFVRLNVTTGRAWGDAVRGTYRVTWDRSINAAK